MNKTLLLIIVLVVLAAGGVLYAQSQNKPATQPSNTAEPTTTVNTPISPSAGAAMERTESGTVKEFAVEGKDFSFSPAEMTVKQGDTVRITFTNTGNMQHDFVIDELGVASKKLVGGEKEMIEFVADKAGTYEYYCSVGNHRAMGMVGTLTVE